MFCWVRDYLGLFFKKWLSQIFGRIKLQKKDLVLSWHKANLTLKVSITNAVLENLSQNRDNFL